MKENESQPRTRATAIARRVNGLFATQQDLTVAILMGAVDADIIKATGQSSTAGLMWGATAAILIYGGSKAMDRSRNRGR